MNLAELKGEIDAYDAQFSSWCNRATAIEKRYEDERPANSTKSKFNILWSNVQTLSPALYDRGPNPNIERRNQDDNDIGRVVSQVLERCDNYFVKTEHFDEVMRQVVLDRLLGGRGVAWARYCPVFGESPQITSSNDKEEPGELYSEDVCIDYVDRRDFGHNVARTWAEVDLVWRKAYLKRAELIKRFPQHGEHIPLDVKQSGDEKKSDEGKKACIYEMWSKSEKKVYWIHKDYSAILDVKPDPLGLKGFFPCPKPVFATLTNKKLVPIPDYVQYQDQARELDNLTGRINMLTKALKVAGVYDSSAEGVQKLLSESTENKLIPVDNWAMFAEKGGLKGTVDFMPIEQIAKVLIGIYDARERTKQDIYEITGISDVIRGATDPNETFGAQELKGKYAGLRLGAMQRDVARFARDLVEIITEIIAEHFDLDTIKTISGVKLLTMAEKQQFSMSMQQAQMMAQQKVQVPPPDKKMLNLMKEPSWEDVEQVIRQDMPRCFIIDIETDSTIKVDQEAEKQARTEFLTATSAFMREAAQIQAPELKPLLMEMLLFGVRGFRAGRELETAFENAMDKIREASEQPQQPQPDPAVLKQEADNANAKAKLDAEQANAQAKLAMDREVKMAEMAMKEKLALEEYAFKREQMKMDSDFKRQAEFEKNKTAIETESIRSKAAGKPAVQLGDEGLGEQVAESLAKAVGEAVTTTAATIGQALQFGLETIAESNRESMGEIAQALEASSKRTVTMKTSQGKTLTATIN